MRCTCRTKGSIKHYSNIKMCGETMQVLKVASILIEIRLLITCTNMTFNYIMTHNYSYTVEKTLSKEVIACCFSFHGLLNVYDIFRNTFNNPINFTGNTPYSGNEDLIQT